jgi:predicted kinase
MLALAPAKPFKVAYHTVHVAAGSSSPNLPTLGYYLSNPQKHNESAYPSQEMGTIAHRKLHGVFIQMSGAPGSGKSTMAKLLRESIGGAVIDHDVIRSSLLEDNDLPFDEAAKTAYRLQWVFADQVAQQGLNVIMDSTCNFQEVLDQGSALAERHGLAYWYVECRVEDIDLLDTRLRTRTPMKSQRAGVGKPPEAASVARQGEDSRAQFRKWIDSPCRPARNVIIVDSTNCLEAGRHHVLKQIGVVPSDECVTFSKTLRSLG